MSDELQDFKLELANSRLNKLESQVSELHDFMRSVKRYLKIGKWLLPVLPALEILDSDWLKKIVEALS